jgi:hypothetical protein
LAIGHKREGRLIVDVIRGQHVPLNAHSFDPQQTTKAYAELLRDYHVTSVVGDHYGAEWVANAWSTAGITYSSSELPKSEIYLNSQPLFTRGLVTLPDHPRLVRELRLLERSTHRSGKDTVDHPRHGSDDYANAVCGLLHALADHTFNYLDSPAWSNEPYPPEPEPFQHSEAERLEYWRGLSSQVYAYSGGRLRP